MTPSKHRKPDDIEESDLHQEQAQELTGDPNEDALLASSMDGQNVFQAAIRKMLWRRDNGKR